MTKKRGKWTNERSRGLLGNLSLYGPGDWLSEMQFAGQKARISFLLKCETKFSCHTLQWSDSSQRVLYVIFSAPAKQTRVLENYPISFTVVDYFSYVFINICSLISEIFTLFHALKADLWLFTISSNLLQSLVVLTLCTCNSEFTAARILLRFHYPPVILITLKWNSQLKCGQNIQLTVREFCIPLRVLQKVWS